MTERVARLRECSLSTTPWVSIECAALLTEFYKQCREPLSVPVQRARAFEYLMEHKTVYIGTGELIVGERGSAPKGTPTYPELCCHTLEDFEILNTREKIAYRVDELSLIMTLIVTGVGALIHLYAMGYMHGDPGYFRFFAYLNLFIFAMLNLVLAENLLVLFLGWEGVGLCSYLLIGYFYKKPSAKSAAIKAFVVNRIGDLGLLMGLFLTFVQFGTLEYRELFPAVAPYVEMVRAGHAADVPSTVMLIPVLFMIGAFGKSAQPPLYVALPDAMEGPTPVSALIHAATMVTAGVYLIARTLPFFLVSEWALPIVAWIGRTRRHQPRAGGLSLSREVRRGILPR